jgi:hypothetical protein
VQSVIDTSLMSSALLVVNLWSPFSLVKVSVISTRLHLFLLPPRDRGVGEIYLRTAQTTTVP